MTLTEQLSTVYLEHEWWHKNKMPLEEANRYHEAMLERGNIISVSYGDKLVGYVEFWRLTYEQFGRIICGEHFSAFHEDVQTGHIAYVANTFILPEYRSTEVYKLLRNRFLETNAHCTHFVGEARRKKSAPVKVFKRSQIHG